jgi:Protein of unknown function (DUF3000)
MTQPTPARPSRASTDPSSAGSVGRDQARATPVPFQRAVASMEATALRPEIRVEPIRPPQRLAPWTYALSAEAMGPDGSELASGRLVLLYDPDGVEAWDGVLRLVAFATAEVEPDIAGDPLLPAVSWSWLTGALADRRALHTAAGGTVTQTTSTRFGDLHGPRTTVALELRASWTACSEDIAPHLLAFADLLCVAAGLPPEGVTILKPSP